MKNTEISKLRQNYSLLYNLDHKKKNVNLPFNYYNDFKYSVKKPSKVGLSSFNPTDPIIQTNMPAKVRN